MKSNWFLTSEGLTAADYLRQALLKITVLSFSKTSQRSINQNNLIYLEIFGSFYLYVYTTISITSAGSTMVERSNQIRRTIVRAIDSPNSKMLLRLLCTTFTAHYELRFFLWQLYPSFSTTRIVMYLEQLLYQVNALLLKEKLGLKPTY